MNINQVIEILKTEKACVSRNDGVSCDRACDKCDLVLKAEDIIEAYDVAIEILGRLL